MAKKKKSLMLAAIPIAVLVLLRIPSLFESYWYGDEAIYAAVAEGMSQGKALYAQIWDHKPPLIFWVFYPGSVFGWSAGFVLLRFFNLLLGVATLFFANEILKQKVKDVPRVASLLFLALALGLPVLEGNVLNAEVIFMAVNMLAFYLIFKKQNFFLVGGLAFLSLATKVPGIVEFVGFYGVVFITYLLKDGFKKLPMMVGKTAIGFAAPLALVLGYFYIRGTLPDFVYANAVFNQIYSLHQGNLINFLGNAMPKTYLNILSLGLVFVFTSALLIRKQISAFFYIAVNLLAIELFASLLSGKNYSHYFLQVVPATTFLIAIFMDKIKTGIAPVKIVYSVVVSLFMIPILFVLKSGGEIAIHAKPSEYYGSFINGYVLGDREAKENFWWANGESVDKAKRFSKYLDENYLDHQNVYLYTDKAWILALTARNLTNKYVVWFHLEYRQEHMLEEINNINRASLFVLDRDPQTLDTVSAILADEFEFVESVDNFEFYERIN